MKFIHCADFHLDAPLTARFSPSQAAQRRSELLHAFGRIADYAAQHGAAAVLIAGDLFDGIHVRRSTMDYVLDTIRRHPNVAFFSLRGNHDAGVQTDCGTLPPNLFQFSAEGCAYRLGSAVIYGVEPAPGDENWYSRLAQALNPSDCNLVLLHGQTASSVGPGQIALNRLRGCGIDYLALGHLHTFCTGELDARGRWAYSGCPEGRGFDECGEKGFIEVEVAADRPPQIRFVPFAVRTLHDCRADLTGAVTLAEQQAAVAQAAAGIPACDIVRVTLCGRAEPEYAPDLMFLQTALQQQFFYTVLQSDLEYEIDYPAYADEISLRGEFYRLVQQQSMPETDRAAILRAGLAALRGEDIPLPDVRTSTPTMQEENTSCG